MTNEIASALIGVGGVIVGALISEILRYVHDRRRLLHDRRRLSGNLTALYFELLHNRLLAEDLEKLEIRTYSHEPGIVVTTMLEKIRQHYDEIDTATIKAIENSYSALQDLTHLVDTGPSGEHKKWTEKGKHVLSLVENTLQLLQKDLKKRKVNIIGETVA
jgi:hypothetical protein